MTRKHFVQLCEACGCRRWHYSNLWREGEGLTLISARSCSQGHITFFKVGLVNEIMKEVMLPGLFEALRPNPLMQLFRTREVR